MTIGRKIALGFACLIVVSAVSGIFLLQLVERMNEQSRRLVEVDYQAGRAALWLQNQLYEIDDFTSRFFATSQPQLYTESLQEKLNDFSAELKQVLQLDLATEDRLAFERLQGRWQEFCGRLDPYLNASSWPGGPVPEEVASIFEALFQESRGASQAVQLSLQRAVEASRATADQARSIPWISTLLALAVAVGLSIAIVGSITRRIVELVRATQRLASGDLSYRVPLKGQDEITELARNFNRMASRLEELDQLKRDFISTVSHDLKAPLASIQETTSLLLEEIPGPVSDKQRRLLRLNLDCSSRLAGMINNLLDLSRLEAGVARYDFKPTEFEPLLQQVVAEVEPLAKDKGCCIGIQWSAGASEAGATVRCDPSRIMQLLRNLLDNAVNFSPRGSAIEVEVGWWPAGSEPGPGGQLNAEGRWLWVAVRDQGPGVASAHREKIFEKFHRVKKGGKLRGQGVGLGLAIGKSIVASHGGRIWVEENAGGGSCFCFVLPADGPAPRVPPPSFSTL